MSYAQTASPEPDIAADVSDLLDWIDQGLDRAAEASETTLPPPPALGEGPVGQAIDWLLGGGDATSASPETADAPARQADAAPVTATSLTAAADEQGAPEDGPLVLTAPSRAAAADLSQGLLLPVAAR